MIVIVDSREQKPLEFNHPFIEDVVVEKLDYGDYGCRFNDGYQPKIYFERKSLGDLYGTLSNKTRVENFKEEVGRALVDGSILVLAVECSYTKVGRGYKHSKRQGSSIQKQVCTMWTKHGLLPMFFKDRSEMSQFITDVFLSFGYRYLEIKKEEKRVKRKAKKE